MTEVHLRGQVLQQPDEEILWFKIPIHDGMHICEPPCLEFKRNPAPKTHQHVRRCMLLEKSGLPFRRAHMSQSQRRNPPASHVNAWNPSSDSSRRALAETCGIKASLRDPTQKLSYPHTHTYRYIYIYTYAHPPNDTQKCTFCTFIHNSY